MQRFSPAIQELLEHLNRLPGVGPKTAKRYLFHLLREPQAALHEFAAALTRVPDELKTCSGCATYSPNSLCDICVNPRRNKSFLCVVADHEDMAAIEATGEFNGIYHVLGGVLSPLDGVTPDKLRISELVAKIQNEKTKEIILALNPDIDGESTMLYLNKLLNQLPVKVTRLARGLPMGSDLEYADAVTLSDAIRGRREIGR